MASQETIAAVATPPGPGGVGIVRVSGPRAADVARELFHASSPGFADFVPYRMHHGTVREHGQVLDEVLLVYMPGPGSFTGEDVAELHCHGGAAVGLVLAAVLRAGARQAGPGEFTRRAFMNGRLDLTQAEAVAEAIAAQDEAQGRAAAARLSGLMGRRVAELRQGLEGLRVGLTVAVDFPEDEVECVDPARLRDGVGRVLHGIGRLREAFARARPRRRGAVAVLAGAVNAGKSSLLNALLGRERAIVTQTPGTTRDYLEESVDLGGLVLRLVDTAGLRRTGDAVELEGVRRSRELLAQADLVVLVVDAAAGSGDEDADLALSVPRDRLVVAANKCDRPQADPAGVRRDLARVLGREVEVTGISARTGRGVEDLADRIRRTVTGGSGPPASELVPNQRQDQALAEAEAELSGLLADLDQGVPYDLLGVRLETACACLDGITGAIAPQDVLDRIFDSFCIGK
jgi:tRNA modification GTPase